MYSYFPSDYLLTLNAAQCLLPPYIWIGGQNAGTVEVDGHISSAPSP